MTNELLLDLHYNYRHNPGFKQTYKEAYQLMEVAKFIHAADHLNDLQSMRQKIGGMDELFHHIEDDVKQWSRIHHRQVGNLGIIAKMNAIESTLHHLMHDLGVNASEAENDEVISGGQEIAPPPLP